MFVAQGYTQIKRDNYGEIFAPFVWLECICIWVAYASYHNFKLYQMDVKVHS
jgi:hypothetical protein